MKSPRTGFILVVSLLIAVAGCAVADHATTSGERDTRTSAAGPVPAKGPVSTGWTVSHVVDGDTVDVQRAQEELRIRLIGIDTPEFFYDEGTAECFARDASAFAEHALAGERVVLEYDNSQGRLDTYGRTLAYVWLDRAQVSLFNLAVVAEGYGSEFTFDDAYAWQRDFQAAEARAREQRLGLWGTCR